MVKQINNEDGEIDWRMAYSEIHAITQTAKASIPLPAKLTHEGMKQ